MTNLESSIEAFKEYCAFLGPKAPSLNILQANVTLRFVMTFKEDSLTMPEALRLGNYIIGTKNLRKARIALVLPSFNQEVDFLATFLINRDCKVALFALESDALKWLMPLSNKERFGEAFLG